MTLIRHRTNVKYLVKINCDWADEATLEGFAVVEPREWEYACKEMEACEYPVEWQWGSNQWVMFESFDQVQECFDISVLNTKETDFLESRFIKYGEFGFTPFGSFQGNAPESFYKEHGNLDEYMKKG